MDLLEALLKKRLQDQTVVIKTSRTTVTREEYESVAVVFGD